MYGNPYSGYGITVFHNQGKIEKIILHMHDRNLDIEYLK